MLRLIIIIFLFGFSLMGISQESSSFPEADSVLVYVYNGVSVTPYGKPRPHLPFPKDINSDNIARYLFYYKKTEEYNLEIEEKKKAFFGSIDTMREFSYYSLLPINEQGKFNPTIIWKSKRKLNDSQIKLLEEFIYIEEKEIYYESPKIYPSSLKCYSPKHTLFFYGNGKIIRHYDICFHCNQVKENGKENIYPINFEEIKKLFVSLDIPTAGEELSNFIRGNN